MLFGSTILGWGIFNFVEGIVDHHLPVSIVFGRMPPDPYSRGTLHF